MLRTVASTDPVSVSPPPPPSTNYWGVTDPKLLRSLHVPVQEVWRASLQYPGFEDVKSDADQAEMYHWNDVDMEPWRKKAPLTMGALLGLVTHPQVWMDDNHRLVAIRKNKIYWLYQNGTRFPINGTRLSRHCVEPCNGEFSHWHRSMTTFLSGPHKIDFPDVVFYLSVKDFPAEPGLPAPLLGFQRNAESEDILVPILHDIKHPLYIFPWEHKVDKGFVRATPFCQGGYNQGFARCARSYFAMRSLYENMSHIMEASLTTGFGQNPHDKDDQVLHHGQLPKMGEFPFRDHARYRFLLDTDGMTGSYRASKLMFFNSPIFKQHSPWFEWYTRSLKEGVHHLKFWVKGPDDIYDLIKHYRQQDAAGLQNMSLNAMKFAYKYCTETPRKLYWRRALTRYKSLFPGMDAWMAAHDWTVDDARWSLDLGRWTYDYDPRHKPVPVSQPAQAVHRARA